MLVLSRVLAYRDSNSHEVPMFSFCQRPDNDENDRRVIDVGWVIDTDKAGLIWEGPRKITRPPEKGTHAKSVNFCPGVIDHDSRLFEVPCPFDIHVGFARNGDQIGMINLDGDQSTIRSKHLNQQCVIVNKQEWRHPDRPIVQFMTPYLFLSDEPVWMNQLPAFYHYQQPPLPGTFIGGRLPVHIWPRHMMWAMEWFDITKPIKIKRGDPWFYVMFETMDPSKRVRVIEADFTPELHEYVNQIKGVSNFVNRTFSLFPLAQKRRPKKLLVPKVR